MSETAPIYTPPAIAGYRQLSQDELNLVNDIKAAGKALEILHARVRAHLQDQAQVNNDRIAAEGNGLEAMDESAAAEFDRVVTAEPQRWAATGKTHLQQGLMALTRAVTQPSTFA